MIRPLRSLRSVRRAGLALALGLLLTLPFFAEDVPVAADSAVSAVPAVQESTAHDLRLDPEATDLTFHLEATGHDVEGTLYLQEGLVHFDRASHEASGRIVLGAARTVTGNAKRDKTMHQKVLESVQFPEIVFVPQRIDGDVAEVGASHFDLVGTLTLHGDTHEVAFATDAEIDENGLVTAHATLDVPFVEWGLEDPSILFLRVAKVVQVDIQFRATLDAPAQEKAAR